MNRKTEAINLRMTAAMKELLRTAAEREHRTLSNMVECLLLDYAKQHGIDTESTPRPKKNKS